ncbi:MAG: transposase [Acetobacteraceae bacterium]|nr:transposase [Acetobacteraceae bacterium]
MPPTFSDEAIQAVLTLKVLYQLPLRAAQGMAGSLDPAGGPGLTCAALQHPLTTAEEPNGRDSLRSIPSPTSDQDIKDLIMSSR